MSDEKKFKAKFSNLAGRPKGSPDRSYLTLQYWFDELKKDWPKLKPAQRAKLSAQLMQMLVNKLKTMPSTPEDSAANASDSLQFLGQLENKVKELGTNKEAASMGLKTEVGPISPIPPESLTEL